MILSLNSVVRNWWPYWWISRPIFLSTKNVCKHLMTSNYKLHVEQYYDEQCPSNTKKWSTEPSYLNDSEAFICIVVMFFQSTVMTNFYSDIIDFKIMWHNFLQIFTPHTIHKQSGADLHTSHNLLSTCDGLHWWERLSEFVIVFCGSPSQFETLVHLITSVQHSFHDRPFTAFKKWYLIWNRTSCMIQPLLDQRERSVLYIHAIVNSLPHLVHRFRSQFLFGLLSLHFVVVHLLTLSVTICWLC